MDGRKQAHTDVLVAVPGPPPRALAGAGLLCGLAPKAQATTKDASHGCDGFVTPLSCKRFSVVIILLEKG
jgi:hypothetical protein